MLQLAAADVLRERSSEFIATPEQAWNSPFGFPNSLFGVEFPFRLLGGGVKGGKRNHMQIRRLKVSLTDFGDALSSRDSV